MSFTPEYRTLGAFTEVSPDSTRDLVKELRDAQEILERVVLRNNELLGVLGDCYDYFDNRADAEYFTDSPSPHPNEEMRILSRIKDLGL